MSYVKIYSGSFIDVEHAKQLLQEKGIEPVVKDNSNSALSAGFGAVMPNFQELYVHSDELEKAKKILEKL